MKFFLNLENFTIYLNLKNFSEKKVLLKLKITTSLLQKYLSKYLPYCVRNVLNSINHDNQYITQIISKFLVPLCQKNFITHKTQDLKESCAVWRRLLQHRESGSSVCIAEAYTRSGTKRKLELATKLKLIFQ